MAKRKKLPKPAQDILSITQIGVTGAVGSSVLGRIGGAAGAAAAAQAQAGIGQVSAGMPIAGTVIGAGMVLDQVKGLQPKGKKDKALYG